MGNCCRKKKTIPHSSDESDGPKPIATPTPNPANKFTTFGSTVITTPSIADTVPDHDLETTLTDKSKAGSLGVLSANSKETSASLKPTTSVIKTSIRTSKVVEPSKELPVTTSCLSIQAKQSSTLGNATAMKLVSSAVKSIANSTATTSTDVPQSSENITTGHKPHKPFTAKALAKIKKTAEENDRADLVTILGPRFQSMHKIVEELYLTGVFGLTVDNLRDNKITCIINTTIECDPIIGFDSLRISIDDANNEEIYTHLNEAVTKIHAVAEAGGRSVVHCMAGVSRSSAIVLAYLIRYKKWTVRRGYNHIVSVRDVARPNSNFLKQLIRYELAYIGTSSSKVIRVKQASITIEMADFIEKDLPEKFKEEFDGNRGMNRVEDEPTPAPIAAVSVEHIPAPVQVEKLPSSSTVPKLPVVATVSKTQSKTTTTVSKQVDKPQQNASSSKKSNPPASSSTSHKEVHKSSAATNPSSRNPSSSPPSSHALTTASSKSKVSEIAHGAQKNTTATNPPLRKSTTASSPNVSAAPKSKVSEMVIEGHKSSVVTNTQARKPSSSPSLSNVSVVASPSNISSAPKSIVTEEAAKNSAVASPPPQKSSSQSSSLSTASNGSSSPKSVHSEPSEEDDTLDVQGVRSLTGSKM